MGDIATTLRHAYDNSGTKLIKLETSLGQLWDYDANDLGLGHKNNANTCLFY